MPRCRDQLFFKAFRFVHNPYSRLITKRLGELIKCQDIKNQFDPFKDGIIIFSIFSHYRNSIISFHHLEEGGVYENQRVKHKDVYSIQVIDGNGQKVGDEIKFSSPTQNIETSDGGFIDFGEKVEKTNEHKMSSEEFKT